MTGTSRREFMMMAAATAAGFTGPTNVVTKYVRYSRDGRISYGILEGETIREIRGGLFGDRELTGQTARLGDVKLLWPCEPTKMLAVGLNYRSHLGDRPAPTHPEMFYKPVSALLAPGDGIVLPEGAKTVHYEGEIVAVIGKVASRVTPAEAGACIFGFTCGNDVSERDWQKGDLQWWRAKGCDTFAPLGPCIATGLDYGKSRLQTRLNGVVKQSQVVSDLLFDPPTVVSWVSRHVTLYPGDVIYTGTPGTTTNLSAGDIVEVEIDGIGTLRNTVRAR
jgi:2-keto-4-pentenoate hydratase/2-oxohepta-3-ene-1,7-dioic acid hydratase in catechol pathway